MAFDMLEAMTMIAREKNIDFDSVVETLEASLLAAAKKKYAFTDNISFKFDRKSNELYMIISKKVVTKVNEPNVEISLDDAKEIDPEAEIGDDIDIYLDYEMEFGRNAINSAKQILIQKIREAEHERIYNEFIDKVGTLVTGVVQQIDKGTVIVNLGRGEAILPMKEQIPREKFRQGDRIRAYIQDVQKQPRGPQIILSRVNNEFLRALFALEVPEIYEKIIEIRAIAREPGERAKIAVYSSDERIDPVGACVGIKGVRVQSIVRELNNERIDIVPFTSSPEVFVTRALAPAKVVAIDVFEAEKKMTVAVEDDKLSLAIGRNGQNARLASRLTGWKVNILAESDYSEQKRREAEMLVPVGDLEGIGTKIRDRLIAADISSIQRLAQASVDMLSKIEGIGPKTAETLIERAKERVVEIEREQVLRDRDRAQAAEDSDVKGDEEKLEVGDVFTEGNDSGEADTLVATAPELDEDELEEDADEAEPSEDTDDEPTDDDDVEDVQEEEETK